MKVNIKTIFITIKSLFKMKNLFDNFKDPKTTVIGIIILLQQVLQGLGIETPENWKDWLLIGGGVLFLLSKDPDSIRFATETLEKIANKNVAKKMKKKAIAATANKLKSIILIIGVAVGLLALTSIESNAQLNYNARRISADTVRARSASQGGTTGRFELPYNFSGNWPSIAVNDTLLHEWIGTHGGGGGSVLAGDGITINPANTVNIGGTLANDRTIDIASQLFTISSSNGGNLKGVEFDPTANVNTGTINLYTSNFNELVGIGGNAVTVQEGTNQLNVADVFEINSTGTSLDIEHSGAGNISIISSNDIDLTSTQLTHGDGAFYSLSTDANSFSYNSFTNGQINMTGTTAIFQNTDNSGLNISSVITSLDNSSSGGLVLTNNGTVFTQTNAGTGNFGLINNSGAGAFDIQNSSASGFDINNSAGTFRIDHIGTERFDIINSASNLMVFRNQGGVGSAMRFENNAGSISYTQSGTGGYSISNSGGGVTITSSSGTSGITIQETATSQSLRLLNENSSGTILISGADVELRADDGLGTGQGVFIRDNRSGSAAVGATYVADYSANFGDRSITDKGYVDGVAFGYLTGSLSATPTDAEIDAIAGTPATVGAGYRVMIEDTTDGPIIDAFSNGGNWYYTILTQAL